ncbi:MAG: hypothetical protein JWM90_190 [Thermoleophilia bacterium]|nr:hypothetical protein [Thermoleophilia bacterium]
MTERLVEALFPANERGDVLALLDDYAGQETERVRWAVLKFVDGDVARLYEALDLANLDFRDALMRADFGEVSAHLQWASAVLDTARP